MRDTAMFKTAIFKTGLAPVLALSVLAAGPAFAAAPGLAVSRPWIRATPPGAMTAAGYMTLSNRGTSTARLMGGSTDAARNLTIHQTVASEGVMRMSATPSLTIRPGRAIPFKPGGYHLMLMGLKAPLKVGQVVKVTLKFESGGDLVVPFVVEQPAIPAADHADHGAH